MNLFSGQAQVRFASWVSLVASLGAIACAAEFDGPLEEQAGSVEEAVIGGSAVSIATQRSIGLVNVNNVCSGALLSPDWVLTATHCIDPQTNNNAAFVVKNSGVEDRRFVNIISQVGQSDITLLKLFAGAAGNEWPTTVNHRVTTSPVALGSLVSCYGRGATQYAFPSGVTAAGSWRTVTRSVAVNDGSNLFIRADNGGLNILAPGDSGGSCFLTNGDIAGVTSFSSQASCVDRTNAATCKATLTSIAEVALASTQRYANYINNVTSRIATTFRPLTLTDGWKPAFGANTPGYALVDGIAYLRGAATTGNTTGSNAVVFTVPPSVRPSTVVYVPVSLCGGTKGRLRIEPTGGTIVEPLNGEWSSAACLTSFDGVKFPVGTGFTELTLRNGWTHSPFSTRRVAARNSSDGWVHLQGAMFGGSSSLAFTLAPAFRPPAVVYATIDLCNSVKGRLEIQPSGDAFISQEGGGLDSAQCFTSLEGVSFYKLNTSGITPLSPLNGWTGAPFSTQMPGAVNGNGTVRFSGGVTTSGTNSHVFTLPPAMRPAAIVAIPIDMCHGNRGRLVIQEDGRAFAESTRPWSNVKCFASLEGLSFGL